MKTITECIRLVLEAPIRLSEKPKSKKSKLIHIGIPVGVLGGAGYVAVKGIKSLINQATQQN